MCMKLSMRQTNRFIRYLQAARIKFYNICICCFTNASSVIDFAVLEHMKTKLLKTLNVTELDYDLTSSLLSCIPCKIPRQKQVKKMQFKPSINGFASEYVLEYVAVLPVVC